MKSLFRNKLFFLLFFLLISVISSENKKENSLQRKSSEEADNNKAEKSSENKIKEGKIKEDINSKEMSMKSDKEDRQKENESKSGDNKPNDSNEDQNKDKKNDDNASKDKPKDSNEVQDKKKEEINENNKNEEDNDDKKQGHKNKRNNEEEDDSKKKHKKKKKKDDEENKDDNKKKHKKKKDDEEDKKDDDENKEEKKSKKDKKKKDKKCEAILLGFDKFEEDKDEDNISFSIYFIPVHNEIKANKLKVPLKIKLKKSLKSLKDEKQIIECKKKYKKGVRQVRFRCVFEKKKKKIEKIGVVVKKLKFIGQEVKIKSFSPLALKNMKNLKKVGKEKQFKNKIYLLENAELKQKKKYFSIMGKIKDKDFEKEKVTLTFLDSKKKENKVDCKIKQKNGKYNFECEPKNDINGNLDGAYGDLEDKNIVINFKNNEYSEINFVDEKKKKEKEKKEKKEKEKKEKKEKEKKEKKEKEKKEKKEKEEKEKKEKIKKKDDDNDEDKKKEKENDNKEVIRRHHRKKKEDNDDDLQFVYEKNVKIDILIYICIGFIILLLITLAYNCIVQANSKEDSKRYFYNNSMDTVKLSTQSNE